MNWILVQTCSSSSNLGNLSSQEQKEKDMAQTMLLTANAKVDLRSKESLVERLKPKPLSSFFLPSLPLKYPSASASASSHFTSTTVALFKSKAKAPAKKVS